jgi:ribonuclease HI
MKFIVHTDGGARGNPGPAAVGVVIEEETSSKGQETRNQNNNTSQIIAGFGKRIGETTNNVAEYTGVIEALKYLRQEAGNKGQESSVYIEFYLDSTLVVNQLNGLFKVKDMKLRDLLLQVRQLEQEVGGNVSYTSVPREENRQADLFVNKALDKISE